MQLLTQLSSKFGYCNSRIVYHLGHLLFYMGHDRPLYLFGLFKQTIQILQQIHVKKMFIQHPDSNSWPSEYESPPLTTRPGLPPRVVLILSPHFIFQIFFAARGYSTFWWKLQPEEDAELFGKSRNPTIKIKWMQTSISVLRAKSKIISILGLTSYVADQLFWTNAWDIRSLTFWSRKTHDHLTNSSLSKHT